MPVRPQRQDCGEMLYISVRLEPWMLFSFHPTRIRPPTGSHRLNDDPGESLPTAPTTPYETHPHHVFYNGPLRLVCLSVGVSVCVSAMCQAGTGKGPAHRTSAVTTRRNRLDLLRRLLRACPAGWYPGSGSARVVSSRSWGSTSVASAQLGRLRARGGATHCVRTGSRPKSSQQCVTSLEEIPSPSSRSVRRSTTVSAMHNARHAVQG